MQLPTAIVRRDTKPVTWWRRLLAWFGGEITPRCAECGAELRGGTSCFPCVAARTLERVFARHRAIHERTRVVGLMDTLTAAQALRQQPHWARDVPDAGPPGWRRD